MVGISRVVIRPQQPGTNKPSEEKLRTPSLTTDHSNDESLIEKPAIEQRTANHLSEAERLDTKVTKVHSFWSASTLLIPNVFRLTSQIEYNNQYVMEYQDLSRKEVLAQNGGFKSRLESAEVTSDSQPSLVKVSLKKQVLVK